MGISYTHPEGEPNNGARRYVYAGDGSARVSIGSIGIPGGSYWTGGVSIQGGQYDWTSYDGSTLTLGGTTVAGYGGNPGTAGAQTAYWSANWGSGSWSGGYGGYIVWEYYAPAAPGSAPSFTRGNNGTTLSVSSASSSGPNVTSYQVAIAEAGGGWSAWQANGYTWSVNSTSTYYVKSRALGYGGASGDSAWNTSGGIPTTPGGAPTVYRENDGTTARVYSQGSSNASYYQVAYAQEGSGWSGWYGDGTTFNLASTANYYFKSRAVNGVGVSGESGATFKYGVSTAPTFAFVRASTAVSGRIEVDWNVPSTVNGAISIYHLYRSGTFIGEYGSGTTYIDDNGLAPGNSYYYTVYANNGVGWSAGTSSGSVTVPGVPGAPTGLTVRQGTGSTDDGKLYIAWNAPSFQNPSITGYDLYRGGTKITLNGTATSYVDTGLNPGTTYTYYVQARNAFADSSGLRSASSSSVSEMAPGLPTVPLNLTATGDTVVEGKVTLAWSTPATTNGAITGYRIWRKLSTDASFPTTPTVTTSGTGTSYSFTGLAVGSIYNFKIAALNAYAVNASKATPETSPVSVMAPGVPSAVTLTSAIASTTAYGVVTLTWTKPTNVGGGVTRYYLYADGVLKTSVIGEDTLTGAITGLSQRQTYNFTVAALNVFADANISTAVLKISNILSEKAPGPPTAPRSLSAVVPPAPAGVVDLAWSAPIDTAGTLTGYGIYFSDGTLIEDTNSAVTSYQVTGLTPAVRYSFYVKARNTISDVVGIDSVASNTATGTALGDPSEPQNLTIDSTSLVVGRLILNWDAPEIGGTINAYNVYRADGTKLGSTGSNTFVVDGLTGGVNQSFYIRARNSVTDAAGTEGGKVSATVTGVPSSTSSQSTTAVTVTNSTNAVFSGTVSVFSLTSNTLSYIKSSSFEVPQSIVPALAGSVVDNTNVTLNGTYSIVSTPEVNKVTYNRVGPNFSTTSVPSGLITNDTNEIFNGTYEVTGVNVDDYTVEYARIGTDVTSRAVPTDPVATISNTTSTVFNADNISISAVTENTLSFLRTNANVEESSASGVVYNNTNREIYNGVDLVITSVPTYQKFTYSTGDNVTKTNLAINPSMERIGTGTSILRTNHYSNPRMSDSTTGWTLLAAGATQTPDLDGTFVDFSEDVAPMEAFFYETSPIAIAVGEYAIASLEVTVPAGYPELTFTSTLRSYGSGDSATRTVTIKPGTTQRITSNIYQTLATSTGVRHLIGSQETIPAGARFIVRNAIFEKSDVLGSYFDGATTDALGFDYEWVGTADASKSVAKGLAVVVRKNEITNPGFEASSAGELLRTNYLTNPSFEAALTGWSSSAGMTQSRSILEAHLGGASLACASTTTSSYALSPAVSASASATYTASAWVKGASGHKIQIGIYEYNSSDVQVGYSASDDFIFNGQWQRAVISRNLTSSAATIKVAVSDVDAGNAGQTFFIDDMLLEKTAFLDDYFDGETPDADGRSYAWTGTANASTSTVTSSSVYATNLMLNPSAESVASGTDILRINLINNPTPVDGLGVDWAVTDMGEGGNYAQDYTGSSFTATTISQASDATFTLRIGAESGIDGRAEVVQSLPYTFSVSVTSSIVDSRAIGIDWHNAAGDIISSTNSSRTQLVPNITQRLSVTGVAPLGAVSASLVAARVASAGVDPSIRTLGSVYTVKDAILEQTDQVLGYFSGGSTDSHGWAYEWDALSNESVSYAKALAVTTRTNYVPNPSMEDSTSGVVAATNLAINPSMEATSGSVTVRENLATNPAMEATTGTTDVRVNLITNPSMETAVPHTTVARTNLVTDPRATAWKLNSTLQFGWQNDRWTPNGTYSLVTGASDGPSGLGSSTYARYTLTQVVGTGRGFAHAGNLDIATPGAVGMPVTAGTTYTFSSYFRYTGSKTNLGASIRVRFIQDDSTWSSGDFVGTSIATVSGTWVRLSVTATAPAGTTRVSGYSTVDVAPTSMAIGDILDGTGLMVEASSTLGDYFDGGTTDTVWADYGWTGTANASTSTAKTSLVTFRENMATNPSFEDATGTVTTAYGTKPAVTGVESATASAIAWQEPTSASHGSNGIAVEWLKYYGVATDSGTGLYPYSTSTTPYDLTDTYVDGVYSLHPDNSLTPVSGEDGLYTIGF